MKKYEYAKVYYERNGHLLVPAKYVCEEGVQLGMWIRTQRVAYKNGVITEKRKSLLEHIGMIWKSERGVKKC